MKTNLRLTIMVNYRIMNAFGHRDLDGNIVKGIIVDNRGNWQIIKRGYDILFITNIKE